MTMTVRTSKRHSNYNENNGWSHRFYTSTRPRNHWLRTHWFFSLSVAVRIDSVYIVILLSNGQHLCNIIISAQHPVTEPIETPFSSFCVFVFVFLFYFQNIYRLLSCSRPSHRFIGWQLTTFEQKNSRWIDWWWWRGGRKQIEIVLDDENLCLGMWRSRYACCYSGVCRKLNCCLLLCCWDARFVCLHFSVRKNRELILLLLRCLSASKNNEQSFGWIWWFLGLFLFEHYGYFGDKDNNNNDQ